MLRVNVYPPIKTHKTYKFNCSIKYIGTSDLTISRRIKHFLVNKGYGNRTRIQFGFESQNFELNHSFLWDSIYPLMFLTRRGGPLFGNEDNRAEIFFEYPILENAKKFFERRASNFGIDVTIKGDLYENIFDSASESKSFVLPFSGGKDSSLVLGMLNELNKDPKLFMTVNSSASENPNYDLNKTKSMGEDLVSRLMPAIMSQESKVYFCGSMGEAYYYTPWAACYDVTAPQPLNDLADLISQYGNHKEFVSSLSVLPSNLIQKILFERYPDLFKAQFSVPEFKANKKNLHVSLCKIYHGIDFSDHCTDELFRKLLSSYVSKQLENPDEHGFRNNNMPFNQEMRSIIYRMKNHLLFSDVKNKIPSSWDKEWIDYIHSYVNPNLDETFMKIFKEHASESPMKVWSNGRY